MSAAHAAGVVHRDVKASNVHVQFRDGGCSVKLLDFGVAKLVTPEHTKEGLTRAGSTIGTPATMAPEQIRGDAVDERTNIYAVGVLLYQMLTGRLPFRAPTPQETEFMILDAPPPPPSQLAPVAGPVELVVLKCLEKIPADRYPSVGAFEEALRAAVIANPSPQQRTLAKQAVAISVAAVAGTIDEEDAELLDDLTSILDDAETELSTTESTSLFQTAASLVGARVLSDDPEAAREQIAMARRDAEAIASRIAARARAHPGLRIEVRVHAAAAFVSGDATAPEIDGPLLDVGGWPAESLVSVPGTPGA